MTVKTLRTVSQFWDWLDRNDDARFWELYNANQEAASPELAAELERHAAWLIGSTDAAAHRAEVNFGC
jgi:hypothetical protein